MNSSASVNVLFVCLGNICRSPTAHGVFQHLVNRHRLHDAIHIDSAGTGDWHIGHAPDKRSTAAALQRGYDLSVLRARQVSRHDFERFDYILAMDAQNLRDLQQIQPAHFRGELDLFLKYRELRHGAGHLNEVPDPYYGGEEGFEQVLDLVEEAADGLLRAIANKHKLTLID
ncbi:MAG: low molecular weight protein-tyrosine-phosphatase [Spongiibacteraceae bacterium]